MSDQPQPTTRVVIDTHGPTITIESVEALGDVLDAAMRAFDHARVFFPGPRSDTTGSISLSAERRDTRPAQPSGMPWAPGPYPIQGEGDTR